LGGAPGIVALHGLRSRLLAPAMMSVNLPKRDLTLMVSTLRRERFHWLWRKPKPLASRQNFNSPDFLNDEPPQKFDWLFEHTFVPAPSNPLNVTITFARCCAG